jgi:phosphohistidine phosphatase SixA
VRLFRLAVLACLASLPLGCGGDQTAPGPATGSAAAPAATRPADTGLVQRLRHGGLVIYIRHTVTSSKQDDPEPDLADPRTQRNLSEAGREQAREIGRTVRRLNIPIGQVLVSPYNRTRETAELAFGKGRARATRDLISEGYPGTDDDELARALRRLMRQRPSPGSNTALVSHGFNLNGATGLSSAEGDTVIFDPGARDPLKPLARIGIDEWRSLKG